MMGRYFFFFFTLIFLVISCDDPVKPIEKAVCTLCDTLNRAERIEDHTSIASYWNHEVSFLSDFNPDEQGQSWDTYTLCNPEVLMNMADEQIIRWSGYIHSSCDSVFQYPLVEIESFVPAPYCPKPLPELDFEPNLWNATWEIESIQTVDTLLYRPCDLVLLGTWFDLLKPNQIGIATYIAIKSTGYLGTINADTLCFTKSAVVTPAEGNGNAQRFEEAYLTVILPFGSSILYTIEGSKLTLRNLETETVVVLGAVGKTIH